MLALLADGLVLVHLAFIVFAVLGAALLFVWPRLVWLHLPALLWAGWIEFSGGICPLTPIEQRWREAAGQAGYQGGFIEHYLVPVIYPEGLTRDIQFILGGVLILVNVLLYGLWLSRRRAAR